MARAAEAFNNLLKSLYRAVPIFVIFGIWELISRFNLVSTSLLPSFYSVILKTIELIYNGILVRHVLVSLYRTFAGLALGILIGVILGFSMATKRHVKRFLDPIITITYPIPKVALVPLTMVWLGVTDQAAIFVVFLGTLLPIIINTYHGVQSVDKRLFWSALSLGTPQSKLFRKVIIPASLPYIFNGIKIALPMAFIVIISVEFVASRAGIGYLISGYGALGLYDYMFAVILIFVLLSFMADRGVTRLSRRFLRWHGG
ncbi:MAG: ABC transporter permease [Candidatus Bathyarchaeia archaeon]